MEPALKELFNQIKITGLINGDSLEKIYSMILSRCDLAITQKKSQIERMYGEIAQLESTRSILLVVLRDFMNDVKQGVANQKLSEELMARRKIEADERLKKALESDGRQESVILPPKQQTPDIVDDIEISDFIPSKDEEAKNRKRARKI